VIYGIGCDMTEIDRLKKAIESEHFYKRVFSEDERNELAIKNIPPQSVAACFAAKEAFSKSIGTGVRGFGLHEISLLHTENGKPYLALSGQAKIIANNLQIKLFHVSVSHTGSQVMCVVVAEQ